MTGTKGELRAILGRHHPAGWAVVVALVLVSLGPAATWSTPGAQGYLWQAIVIAAALGLGAGLVAGSWRSRPSSDPGLLAAVVAGSGLLLLGWAAVSILWAGGPRPFALVTIALAGSTAALGLLPAVATAGDGAWFRLIHDGAVAVVAASGVHALALTDQVGRVTLPIGAASTAHMPLLLALAVLVTALVRGGGEPLAQMFRGLLVLVALTLLASGASRYGVVAASVLCLAVAVRVARTQPRRRWLAVAAGLGVAGILVTIAFVVRPGLTLADGARSANHRAALGHLVSPPPQLLVGEGFGGLWPWLALETSPPGGLLPVTRETSEGALLWHPHSLYLGVVGELGLVGAALLGTLVLAVLVACAIVWVRDDALSPAALALALTIPGMAFDLLLLRDYPGSLLWWLVAAAVLQHAGSSTPMSGLLRQAAARTRFAPGVGQPDSTPSPSAPPAPSPSPGQPGLDRAAQTGPGNNSAPSGFPGPTDGPRSR